MRRPSRAPLATLLVAVGLSWGCETAPKRPPVSSAPPAPSRRSAPLTPATSDEAPELSVRRAPEEVVVSAWAEPSHLPPGGGVVQILVRARYRGGAPFPGVEVRLWTSAGTLFSHDRVLVTDAGGLTRDQLTARKTAEVVMNAGGTRYRIVVPVLPE
ncbi:MAG TPA: hypothetical protein VFM88_13545 [Vicinamibacteria bacterium]|nr:hypothetical protein [Vicinamibacteria bacterium]